MEEEIAVESQPRKMHDALVERMRSTGLADELRREIPFEFTEAIAFLDAAFWRHDMRSVIDILAAVTPEAVRQWGYTRQALGAEPLDVLKRPVAEQ